MGEPVRLPWKFIEPLSPEDAPKNGSFAALEALRGAWDGFLSSLTESETRQIRQRSLRRLAVETGILERIYDIDWGLTQTLVAEGFARDVIERQGGQLGPEVLATLQAQRDALQLVLDFARDGRPLSTGFIRELHAAMTRTQASYRAHDALGRSFDRPLRHGDWKHDPNHVVRSDGSVLEYTPPDHVPAEMDRLVALYGSLRDSPAHPITKAAWFHHRFVQIHPFEDGNGRVARALTLLVLQQHHYAPLVVDRFHRDDYLRALDEANDGKLKNLVSLFIRLESNALTSELERPLRPGTGVSTEVAHTLATQLRDLQTRKKADVASQLKPRAIAVAGYIENWFRGKRQELRRVFRDQQIALNIDEFYEWPPSERSPWFRQQIVESARRAGHVPDFDGYAGYAHLKIAVGEMKLRFIASIHGAGREGGVMAVTTLAEVELAGGEGSDGPRFQPIPTTSDTFAFVHTEAQESIQQRFTELNDLLDAGLSVALVELQKRLIAPGAS